MAKVKINIKMGNPKPIEAPIQKTIEAPIHKPIKVPIKVLIQAPKQTILPKQAILPKQNSLPKLVILPKQTNLPSNQAIQLPKVVAYDEMEESSDNWDNIEEPSDDWDNVDWENVQEPVDSPIHKTQSHSTNVSGKILIKINNKTSSTIAKPEIKAPISGIIKVVIHKKPDTSKTTYTSQILAQKAIKKAHIKIDHNKLYGKISIETFYDEGVAYFVDWQSGYIFPPNINLDINSLPEPIGKIHDKDFNPDDCPNDKIPIKRRTIEWFYHFDMDADIIA